MTVLREPGAVLDDDHDDPPTPQWYDEAVELAGPLVGHVNRALAARSSGAPKAASVDLQQLPSLALRQFLDGTITAVDANFKGRHATAVALLRQGVEALTIVELGLVDTTEGWEQLKRWSDECQSQGALRKYLEHSAWSSYGDGLWSETWAAFSASLARSVQPYAHLSARLLQWQLKVRSELSHTGHAIVLVGEGVDPIKRERVALALSLQVWMLGRVALVHTTPPAALRQRVFHLGQLLAGTRWLTEGADWSEQLLPHVWLRDVE